MPGAAVSVSAAFAGIATLVPATTSCRLDSARTLCCVLHTVTNFLLLGSRISNYFTDAKTPKGLSNLPQTLRYGPESVHPNELGFKKEQCDSQPDWVAGRDKTGPVMKDLVINPRVKALAPVLKV